MSNNACADGNSRKHPFIVAFSDCRRSVGIDIVIIQILLEKEDQRASLQLVPAVAVGSTLILVKPKTQLNSLE